MSSKWNVMKWIKKTKQYKLAEMCNQTFSLKSANSTFLGLIWYRKTASFIDVPVRKSQIRKFVSLIRKSQIR